MTKDEIYELQLKIAKEQASKQTQIEQLQQKLKSAEQLVKGIKALSEKIKANDTIGFTINKLAQETLDIIQEGK